MKLLIYTLSAMLIGLSNTSVAGVMFQFIKASNLAVFASAAPVSAVAMADRAVHKIKESKNAATTLLGYTAKHRPIYAYFFPGTGPEYALVVGGVHGSELSAVELAYALADSLADKQPRLNVIVVPELFADNVATAASHPHEIGSVKNIGRYTNAFTADPNRQMPPLGTSFIPDHAVDFAGRAIENENQALLHLIQQVQPGYIFSLHAIRNTARAGIYADPRTDGYGYAHGFAQDSTVALWVAKAIAARGGAVPGNDLKGYPSALYPTDPPVVPAGALQPRNTLGSNSAVHRGYGVSLGSWASTADRLYEASLIPRHAAMMFTVEFPGSRRQRDYTNPLEREQCRLNIEAYAGALSALLTAPSAMGKP